MFTPSSDELAQDWATRRVDFGGYQFHSMFDRGSPHYRPLPAAPPRSAREFDRECGCRHCASEGWYAQSPLCRFWRSDCELCRGQREWTEITVSPRGGTATHATTMRLVSARVAPGRAFLPQRPAQPTINGH